jgi:4-hydroxy-3-polyprenylbenzoate decarboxylase
MDIFVGISGGSGAPYARRLVQVLAGSGHTVGVSFSGAGSQVAGQELYEDLRMPREEVIERFIEDTGIAAENVWSERDYASPYASGSAMWDAAVICPCSMATVSAIAGGAEANLIHRAANVALKEQRKLIIVPRETPLSLIQLEKLKRVARAGAHVVTPIPAFYTLPKSIDDMVDFMAGKLLNLLGVRQELLAEWRGQ